MLIKTGTSVPLYKIVSIGDINFAGADTNTDKTNKNFTIAALHYDNNEEPLSVIYARSTGLSGLVAIGGGSSILNASTRIEFYTASMANVINGTPRMVI